MAGNAQAVSSAPLFSLGLVITLLPIALLGCAAPHESSSVHGDELLAIVGDRGISARELESRILERFYDRRALLGLIRESLWQQEAERLGVEVDRDALERRIDREIAALGPELATRLSRVGLTVDDQRKVLAIEIENAMLRDAVVRAHRRIGEYEIQQRWSRTYAHPQARARHMFFAFQRGAAEPDGEAIASAMAKARAARLRYTGGEDFSSLASELSEHPDTARVGGAMGWRTPENVEAVFRDVLFTLPIGEISSPIREGDSGVHLLIVDERLEPIALEDCRERIRKELRTFPATPEEEDWVERDIRRRIFVETFDENLKPYRPSRSPSRTAASNAREDERD